MLLPPRYPVPLISFYVLFSPAECTNFLSIFYFFDIASHSKRNQNFEKSTKRYWLGQVYMKSHFSMITKRTCFYFYGKVEGKFTESRGIFHIRHLNANGRDISSKPNCCGRKIASLFRQLLSCYLTVILESCPHPVAAKQLSRINSDTRNSWC